MKLVTTLAAATLLAATLAGCSSKDKPSADPTPRHAQVSRSASSPSSSPSSSLHKVPQASLSAVGGTNTIDACQIVTQDEASSLAHASFGPGKEEGNKVRHECVYGAETPNVFTVFVIQAASADDAQAGWNQLLAEAQQAAGQASNLVQLTPDSGIGDQSEWAELDLAQIGVSGRGLAFLKGSVGVYMIDVVRGGAAASRDDLTTEAQTVLTRLP